MKTPKLVAAAAAAGLALGLAACSEDSDTPETTTETKAVTSEAAPAAEMPTAEELNAVLQRAADPNLPISERANTVQGGETSPELFDLMTQSQQQSGANFQVVNPVLPGYTANSVLATVNFTRPDAESQLAEDVEFVHEDGNWKTYRVVGASRMGDVWLTADFNKDTYDLGCRFTLILNRFRNWRDIPDWKLDDAERMSLAREAGIKIPEGQITGADRRRLVQYIANWMRSNKVPERFLEASPEQQTKLLAARRKRNREE